MPWACRAWFARRRFPFEPRGQYVPIPVLHPKVEEGVRQGIFQMEKLDVFSKIKGQYDLILSFNLLQKNYFPQNQIDVAIGNLNEALREAGLLVIGNDQQFCVWKKVRGKLIMLERNGEF
jgi:chemotaxis methyl-accepting protein methylase